MFTNALWNGRLFHLDQFVFIKFLCITPESYFYKSDGISIFNMLEFNCDMQHKIYKILFNFLIIFITTSNNNQVFIPLSRVDYI